MQGAFPEALLAGLDDVGSDGLLEREHQPGADRLDDGRGAAFLPRDRVVEVTVADRVDEGDGAAAGHGGHPVAHQVAAHDQDAGVCGPPMNLCGDRKMASLWSPAPGADSLARIGTYGPAAA